MKKYFNTAGPCNDKAHYMVPAISRNKEIVSLIDQGHYFVIHAPRQTGKTTLLLELTNKIDSEDQYYALYCSLESVNAFPEPERGIPEILYNLKSEIKYSKLPHRQRFAENSNVSEISTLIKNALRDYCALLDKPLVVFFDEIDGLADGTLVTLLRQLRDGFITRGRIPFVHSIALVGMRNIRDFKSRVREDHLTIGSASPFNIITEALTVKNFSLSDVKELYAQHAQATGQLFEAMAVEEVFEQTDGQPWLVNAIAREIVQKILDDDYTKPITVAFVEEAIQSIILRRDTHIDSLLDKLKDPRVLKVLEPVILGKTNAINLAGDDARYCLDLGLIKDRDKVLQPANKIYAEVIIRSLNYNTQYHLNGVIGNNWIDDSGNVDMDGLLMGFQQFWRENSDVWSEKYEYKEAAPHLILQAFLQRIINGGGSIIREYASGRERMDLCVVYGKHKYPVELKLMYSKAVVQEGIAQISKYMTTLGETIGWLVIFDRSNQHDWERKIFWKTENSEGKTIHVVGC
jgi:hypothetical protein